MEMNNLIKECLYEIYETGGILTKSNFAKKHADGIAAASSAGLISTLDVSGMTYCRTWRLTPKGLKELYEYVDYDY